MYEDRIRNLEIILEGVERKISATASSSHPSAEEIAKLSRQKSTLVDQLRDLRRWQRDYYDEFGNGYDE